jgi:hypothetical protein
VARLIVGAVSGISVAAAAPYYADPDGVGPVPCLQSDPCSLATAVANATDEVILLPGSHSYDLGSSSISVSSALDVHGDLGQPRPLLVTSSGFGAFHLANAGARLRHVRIESTTTAVFVIVEPVPATFRWRVLRR